MNVRPSKHWVRGALVALAVPVVAVGAAAPAHAATSPAGAYAEAFGLLVDTTALSGAFPVEVGPEAPVASSCPSGGTKTAQVLGAGDPAAARADVITTNATTVCAPASSTATSRLVNVDALGAVAQAKIHADAVTATSTTSCTAAPKGSTKITNLSIGGTSIPVPTDVPPNTGVQLDPVLSNLGLRVILNEQHPAAAGRGLVVNAIHVIAGGAATIPIGGSVIRGDVIIGHTVSGVVCPGGPGQDNAGLPKPDISFFKSASPSVAKPGQTVTYTAIVSNQSTTPCEVLKFIDHIAPAFELVSSAGPLGTALVKPAPTRTDGGVDAVLYPKGVTIGAGKSVSQTFVVKVKDGATPGTYYNSLEIYCGRNGDFVSGPMAPVTVPAAGEAPPPPVNPVTPPPGPVFAPTGLNTGLAATALLALVAAAGVRRLQLSRR